MTCNQVVGGREGDAEACDATNKITELLCVCVFYLLIPRVPVVAQ